MGSAVGVINKYDTEDWGTSFLLGCGYAICVHRDTCGGKGGER